LRLRPPGDDAEARAAVGHARGEHRAPRGQGVPGVDRPQELDLPEAEERAARLAQVLDAEAYRRAEDEERIHDDVGMAMGPGVLGVQVEGVEGEGRGREERVVAGGQGASPVVREDLALVEFLEGAALPVEGERGEVRAGHDVGVLARTSWFGSLGGSRLTSYPARQI